MADVASDSTDQCLMLAVENGLTMEKGTAYIEYTAKTLISVTNTFHAEVDGQYATASEVRQNLLYITHILSCKICNHCDTLQRPGYWKTAAARHLFT